MPLPVPNWTPNTVDKCSKIHMDFSLTALPVPTASQGSELHFPELLPALPNHPLHLQKENFSRKSRCVQNYSTEMDVSYPWKIRQHHSLPYYSLSASGIPTQSLNTNPLLSHSGLFLWFLPLCAHGFKTYLCLFFSKRLWITVIFFACPFFFLAALQDVQLSLLWHSLWT